MVIEHNINSWWLYHQWCYRRRIMWMKSKCEGYKFSWCNGWRFESPYHSVDPKKPSHIIVHAGTNGTYHSTSRKILKKLLKFKSPIQVKLPDCKVFILTPTLHSNNGIATLTVNQLTNLLLQLNIDIVDNRNINSKHLSRKGLHLNESGSRR